MKLCALLSDRRMQLLGLLVLLGSVLGVFFLERSGLGMAEVKAASEWLEEFMTAHPWVLFLAIVILPGLPAPISPVMVLAGAIFHEHALLACLACLAALLVNLSWTYWVAAKPGRGLVRWMFERAQVQVPVVAEHNHMKWLLIVRLTPGFPLFIQSYLLGFVGIAFWRYLWVSFLCSGSIACGMVLTGAGVGDGRIGPILGGVGVLVVVVVVLKVVGGRLATRS